MPQSAIGSRIALVLAAVVLPFAVLSIWLEAVVTDTDRYVDTVAPLANDPIVQQATQAKLETVVLNAIDFDQRRTDIADLLNDQGLSPVESAVLSQLAATLDASITTAVHNASVKVVEAPEFADAWEDANRSAHTQLIGVLSGEDQLSNPNGAISVQLSTLVTAVIDILDTEGVVDASQLPDLEASFTFVQGDQLEKAQTIYDALDLSGFWLPLLWLALVALAIVLAVDRRRTIRWLSYGSILGLILLAIALRIGRNQLPGAGAPGDEELVLALWSILVVGLKNALRVMLVAALLVLAATWLTGPTGRAVRLRERVGTSTQATSAAAMAGPARAIALGAAVLVVLIWVL